MKGEEFVSKKVKKKKTGVLNMQAVGGVNIEEIH